MRHGHHAKFCGDRSNRCWDMAIFRFFQDDGCPPYWICDAHVWTTHEGHLVVFITVQNLVGINTLVSIASFWATVCKTVRTMLSDRCLSCLSCLSVCLSVTLAYSGQTVGWIKMKLDIQVGLGPVHIVC